ncbi:MAG: orotidine-5'-phosphate decarboxylase [Candidatus Peribacteraceae bacterium]|nr:orotidine-5'-phosphate decarboxylase [Candidatus Peribacteraceae bacterium]
MHYADRLQAAISQKSPVCVGLDPVMEKLPQGVDRSIEGIRDFCYGIIEATKDIAAAIKPQMAYFELLGWPGMKLFFEVCEYAKNRGLIVIADGKRNDIGPTCEAYADAYLYDGSPIDALTITPFMGSDGVLPFVDRCVKNEKGIYVQVKNSNPSSGELQDLPIGDEVVHEYLAQLVEGWAMHHIGEQTNLSCVGAVVGATYPEEMKYLRTLMPHVPFLVPGYGAQGATAKDCVHAFLPDGTAALVTATRSIIYAASDKNWQDKAGEAAADMAEALKR